jgi:penicillin amidase
MPPGSYPPAAERYEGVGQAVGEPGARTGSNNWVVSGRSTASGLPMVASDPHIAFGAAKSESTSAAAST